VRIFCIAVDLWMDGENKPFSATSENTRNACAAGDFVILEIQPNSLSFSEFASKKCCFEQ